MCVYVTLLRDYNALSGMIFTPYADHCCECKKIKDRLSPVHLKLIYTDLWIKNKEESNVSFLVVTTEWFYFMCYLI